MIRRSTARILKTTGCVAVFMFLWVQLFMVGLGHMPSAFLKSVQTGTDRSKETYSQFLQQVSNVNATPWPNNMAAAPEGVSLTFSSQYMAVNANNLSEVKMHMAEVNSAQRVVNEDRFGPVKGGTVVFVVQVHERVQYLQSLVESLSRVRGIEQAMIIFSHDVYDVKIEEIVHGITFCKVMQIFYPFSIQIFPKSFPGQDENDCPWDAKKDRAITLKCNNAEHPDLYGHYREAKFAQIKHHWWWKIARIFEGIKVLSNHTGLFVFLEEDHYVVEDLLWTLKSADSMRAKDCSHCNIISLGTYLKVVNFNTEANRMEIWPWIASKHNMGMAFRKETWLEIKACAENFCNYDDYNWDWSLQHISSTCMKNKLTALMVKAPRVFHIGQCGVHHKKKNCEVMAELNKVQKTMSKAGSHLFPAKMTITRTLKKTIKPPKGNGGWGDVRDHWLCLHLLNTTLSGIE